MLQLAREPLEGKQNTDTEREREREGVLSQSVSVKNRPRLGLVLPVTLSVLCDQEPTKTGIWLKLKEFVR